MKQKFTKIHDEFSVAPLTQLMNFGYPSKEMRDIIKYPKCTMLAKYQAFTVSIYFIDQEWEGSGKHIINLIIKNRAIVDRLLKKAAKVENSAFKSLQSVPWHNFSSLSNQEIYKQFKQLTQYGFLLSVYSQLGAMADHWHGSLSKRLADEIINKTNYKLQKYSASEIISLLNLPDKPFYSDLAKVELVDLKKTITKKPKQRAVLVKKYLTKWFWLNYGQMGPGLDLKTLNKEIKQPTQLTNFAKIVSQQKKLGKVLHLNKAQGNLFYASRNFVYLKSRRVEICSGICAFIHKIIHKISVETGVSKELLFFCSVTEVLSYLKNNKTISVKVLRERKNYSVWIANNALDVKILAGKKGREFIKRNVIKIKDLNHQTTEVKGSVAFSGKAKGLVKIVNIPSDMSKMKKGDIMVSLQTTPELLPAMKKAAAFVTDIGGIISHAALVAREFKIPCIVGTRISTQVFKDGDLVEVDATKGIIKKL